MSRMKCVVFSSEWPALPLASVEGAISAGWARRCSENDLTFVPLPLHGAGMVTAIGAMDGAGTVEELTLEDGTTVPWRRLASLGSQWPTGCVVFDATHLMAGMSTWKVGLTFRELAAHVGPDLPVVAYVPTATVSDGGSGFLAAVCGEPAPVEPGATDQEQLRQWWQDFAGNSRFGIVYDLVEPYLRPGIDALRGEPESAAAQRAERVKVVNALAECDVDVNPLLGQAFAGCGGGLGLLAAQSAGAMSACEIVALLVNQVPLDQADLALVAIPVADWRILRDSVVTVVADAASAQVVPVVVLAGAVDVGRRELSSIGVSAAYGCRDDALAVGGLLAVDVTAADITARAESVARTWAHPKA